MQLAELRTIYGTIDIPKIENELYTVKKHEKMLAVYG